LNAQTLELTILSRKCPWSTASYEVHGSVASLEQKDGQCVIDPDSAGSRLRVAINHYLANAAGEAKSLLMLT